MSDKRLEIQKDVDPILFGQQSIEFAKSIGFSGADLWRIAIATRELVSNVIKYAGSGTLLLSVLQPQCGIRLIVSDRGPGIANIEAALVDGYTEGRIVSEIGYDKSVRGTGTGLGAVSRLMDKVEIKNRPEGGLEVKAEKLLSRD